MFPVIRAQAPTFVLCVGLGVGFTSGVSAQPQFEEVIVVGPKRAVSSFDYDGLIGVINSETLAQQQVESIDDLGRSVSGLVFRSRGNRAYDNITLRGQSSVDFYEPKVQVYIDGFVQDQATFGNLLPDHIDQVEVLYGPQGSLYGRGIIGGVIDVVTLSPAASPGVQVATGQSNVLEEYKISLSSADIQGWSADIGGVWRDKEGEYKASTNGGELGDRTDKNYRARLHYDSVDSPWTLNLQVAGSHVDSSEEQYVLQQQLDERVAFPVQNDYQLSSDFYSLRVDYDLEAWTLSSLTSYQDRELDRVVFGAASPEDQATWTQELRLSSPADDDSSLHYTAGIYYENIDFSYLRPDYAMASYQDIESIALFGEVSWQMSQALTATLGLRVEERDVEATGTYGSLTLSGEDDFAATSPKLALGYQLSETTRFYGVYSTGYKAGGFTRLATPWIASFSYEPEEVDNFEVGIKQGFMQGRGQWSLAAYWMRNHDFQLYVGESPNQYLQNVGDAESKGIDINLNWSIDDSWTLALGYAWNDAEFTEYDNPLTPGVDLSGNTLPYAPEHSANASISYRLPLPDNWGSITAGLQANYTGDIYFDESNSFGEDALTLYNMTVDWQMAEHYGVQVYGTNLSDEDYIVYGFEYTGVGSLYQLGQGREVGIRLSAEF